MVGSSQSTTLAANIGVLSQPPVIVCKGCCPALAELVQLLQQITDVKHIQALVVLARILVSA